jgi:hypothetical protein
MIMAILGANLCLPQAKKKIDLSKAAVVLPFESTVNGESGLPDATRTAVFQFLRDEGLFSAVLTPEEAKDRDKATMVEISAKLTDFAPGGVVTHIIVGLLAGREHAVKDRKHWLPSCSRPLGKPRPCSC